MSSRPVRGPPPDRLAEAALRSLSQTLWGLPPHAARSVEAELDRFEMDHRMSTAVMLHLVHVGLAHGENYCTWRLASVVRDHLLHSQVWTAVHRAFPRGATPS